MPASILAALLVLSIGRTATGAPPGDVPKGRAGQANVKPPMPKKENGKKARPPRNLAVKAVRMVVEDAEFDEMPFGDFVEWLARRTKANVVARWRILEAAGVERDRPVTLKRKNIKVKHLLRLVFAQVTKGLGSVELAAKADGNTLIISTRKDINTKLIVRTYDVRDLLLVVPDFAGRRLAPIDAGGGVALGRQKVRPTGTDAERLDEPVRRLIESLTWTIQPRSWQVRGGRGTILYFKGRLVIRNNIEVHQQLAEMLGERGPEGSADRPRRPIP